MQDQTRPEALDQAFVRRTLFVIFAAGGAYVGWQLSSVLLLVFGAVVVAVLLRALADPIAAHTPLAPKLAVGAAALGVVAAAGLAVWLFGDVVAGQIATLMAQGPGALQRLEGVVAGWPFAQVLFGDGGLPHISGLGGVAGQLGAYALGALGAVGNVVVVLFTGLFLALDPGRARNGLIALLPKAARPSVGHALDASGRALRLWLLGMLADMAGVGLLTGLGAWAIGLPSALALGVLAALFDFVPIVGPIVSVVPGLVVAAPEGPAKVLWTALMYLAVQQTEGNLIYPMIQKRAVDLPPSLSLMAVVAAGVLFGLAGVVLATPLLVVGVTAVKILYVQDTLGGGAPDEAGRRGRGRARRGGRTLPERPSGNTSDGVDPAGAGGSAAPADGYLRALEALGRRGPDGARPNDEST